MILSHSAISAIKSSNKIIGALMGQFDKHQNTIESWVNPKHAMHKMLTIPEAVQIISELSKIPAGEILTEEPVLGTAK